MAEHILIAGKDRVGKSTTAANLAAALAEAGHNVVMVGYDPRHNSTVALRSGSKLIAVVKNTDANNGILFAIAYKGSLCVETGELSREGDSHLFSAHLNALITSYDPHFIIHDLWHRPDGSFVLPPLSNTTPRLLVVTSGELASIHSLNDLFSWLNNLESSDCRFAGVIINNSKNKVHEMIVNDYVSRTSTSIIASFEHSMMVSMCDYLGETLLEAAPNSHDSVLYRMLAQQIIKPGFAVRPTFFDKGELEHWSRKWYDIISNMESGVVMDGSGI